MMGSDLSVLIKTDAFLAFYTPVSISARGPVLKLTMLHCFSGKMNGLIEMPDP